MVFKKKNKKKSRFKRSLVEWGIVAAIIAVIYFTGWSTEILGGLQRVILWTGLHNAKTHEVSTAKRTTLSKRAYNMQLAAPDGEQVRLGKYKGKVLFINIWASWCPPCVAELPTIEKLYNNVSDNDNIKFLLISMDKKEKKADAFMKRKAFPMPYYFPVSGIPTVFRSSYIPSTYVISKKGEIIYNHDGIANYNTKKFREWLVEQANK